MSTTDAFSLRHLAALLFGLWLSLLSGASLAQTLELRDAQATITVQGKTTQQSVQLPYHWDRAQTGQAGQASFDLAFDLPLLPDVSYGLYISKLGNAYAIWLNGSLLERKGDLLHYNGPNFAKSPRHILIAPGLLRTTNWLHVEIRTDNGRRGGLSALILGPDDEVYPRYLRDFRINSIASFSIVIVGLLIGLVAMALWATQVDSGVPGQPQRDRLYLFAGIAELCAAIGAADLIIESTPLPWPWWGLLPEMAEIGWECSIVFFCIELAGWWQRRDVNLLVRWMPTVLLAGLATSVGFLIQGNLIWMAVFDTLSDFALLLFSMFFLVSSLRNGRKQLSIVAMIIMLTMLVDMHHTYVQWFSLDYASQSYQPVSSLLFGLAVGLVVMGRFRWTSDQLRQLVTNMGVILAGKEQEIEKNYQRTEQLVRERERTLERARILRDMHDGVGSHISTAIHQLQSGKANHDEVMQTLRDSLDQLKLTIDAMNLPAGDITSLLANLRYRLEPRLKASNIELQWNVDLLAPLTQLDDKALRHLQYMVFEAISNVLQHSRASLLRIELQRTVPGGARLRIIDNGVGFDPQRIKTQGLRSLRERAAAIGAQLQISSVPGHSVVEIELL